MWLGKSFWTIGKTNTSKWNRCLHRVNIFIFEIVLAQFLMFFKLNRMKNPYIIKTQKYKNCSRFSRKHECFSAFDTDQHFAIKISWYFLAVVDRLNVYKVFVNLRSTFLLWFQVVESNEIVNGRFPEIRSLDLWRAETKIEDPVSGKRAYTFLLLLTS